MHQQTNKSFLKPDQHTARNAKRTVRPVDSKEQSAEAVVEEATQKRLAELRERGYEWIKRGREANVECGRTFIEIQRILRSRHKTQNNLRDRREWGDYFRKWFKPKGVPFRTAQSWMKAARKAEDLNAILASKKPVETDPRDREMLDAVEKTHAEMAKADLAERAKAKSERIRLEGPGLYTLRIHLKGDEMDALDELQKSEHWAAAERQLAEFLRRLLVEYGITNADTLVGA